ncbi:MAG: hypothetical protein RQ826_08655 [Xanthomonadales bacterium]|nr:hypothetical protein [Xanthomonadales bacterium]
MKSMTIAYRYLLPCLALLTVLLAAGCSSKDKKPEYYDYKEVSSLEIPPGLDQPTSASALVIRSPYMPVPAAPLQPMPPRIVSTTDGAGSNARLHWSAQGMYLLIEDTPASVERRLGLALERGGMQDVRKEEDGVYRFDYYQVFEDDRSFFKKLAFWSRDKGDDFSGTYRALVEPDGKNSRVYLQYADRSGVEPGASEHLLRILGERLG